jgi:hypothetical protein
MLPRGTDTTVRQQEVEILEGETAGSGDPSTLQKARGHQPDAMEMVRNLQARIEVKKEVMEEEHHEHARRHAQLQSVVEAKIQEAAELRGRLNDIALAFECTLCFEKLGAGSVSFGCGHTYCNRATCGSRLVDTCPECRLPVASRVQLFGTLPDVGGLLEHEPAAPDVEQVQWLASENAKASLEEMRKRSEENKAVWQREKKEMKRQVNRLQEEVLAAANAKASLEEIRKRSEEDKTVWQRDREAVSRNSTRDKKVAKNEELQEALRRLSDELHERTNAEINYQGLIDFQASRLFLPFASVTFKAGIVNQGTRNVPPMPTEDHVLYPLLTAEQGVVINYTGKIDFSGKVEEGPKKVTTRWSHECIQEPRGCVETPAMVTGVRKRAAFDTRFETFLSMRKPASAYEAHIANLTLAARLMVLPHGESH